MTSASRPQVSEGQTDCSEAETQLCHHLISLLSPQVCRLTPDSTAHRDGCLPALEASARRNAGALGAIAAVVALGQVYSTIKNLKCQIYICFLYFFPDRSRCGRLPPFAPTGEAKVVHPLLLRQNHRTVPSINAVSENVTLTLTVFQPNKLESRKKCC